MTISTTTDPVAGPFEGDDSQTVFPFGFKTFAKADLKVVLNDGATETTLVLDSDYSVALNADQNSNPGGSITYPISGTPLATGDTLTIGSSLSFTQPTQIPNPSGFYPRIIEDALDRCVMLIKQAFAGLGRSLRFPLSETGVNTELPTATARALKTLTFDADGNPVCTTPAAGTADALAAALLDPDTGGASMVFFRQSGAGAVARSLQSKSRDSVSIKDFGAVGDDATDDTAAIQAAIDAVILAGGGTVYFPAGRYRVTGTLYVRGDQLYMAGQGARASAIRVYHNLGPAVVVEHATTPGSAFVNGFGMINMSVRARLETTTGSLLKFNKVQLVTLHNLFLEDHFGGMEILGGANYYVTNLMIFSPRTSAPVSWPAAKAGSFFLKVGRSSDGQIPFEMFFSNFNFRRTELADYIDNGIVINCCDGLWLSNGHIMGVNNADMRVEPVTGNEQITGIRCDNIWFDNNSALGLHVVGDTSVSFGQIELNDCKFLSQGNSSIFVEASSITFEGLRINGGHTEKPGNYGFILRGGRRHVINGFEFAACNTNGIANAGGLVIDNANADHITVSGCSFAQTTRGVTAPLMLGVRINVNAVSEVLVNGCDFDLAADSADISDSSTSDRNRYVNCTTTKNPTAASVTGTSLNITEIGDTFYVTDGLNFDNLTGRWDQRRVTLIFAGASTVTHGIGGIRLAGSVNFVAKAGDTLTLVYINDVLDWVEASRMVS